MHCIAIQWQHGMVERDAAAPGDNRIEFRIGVHQGDIVVENDDIFGDGVNVADPASKGYGFEGLLAAEVASHKRKFAPGIVSFGGGFFQRCRHPGTSFGPSPRPAAHGNRLTVGIVAMFAEEERRAISADMAALAVAKGTR